MWKTEEGGKAFERLVKSTKNGTKTLDLSGRFQLWKKKRKRDDTKVKQ